MEIRSSNPVLSNKFWSNLTGTDRMTVDGSMKKIGYLLSLTIVSALVSAVLCMNALNNGTGGLVIPGLMGLGFLGGFIVAMGVFLVRPNNPAALMSLYAILEGLAIGAMSLMLELTAYKGIALQAVFGTMAITATMYVMYASRIIRPTPAFNKIVFGLVASIMFLYLTSFVLQLFTPYDVPFLHSSGPIGIGVTAFILVVAALTLISDFGFYQGRLMHFNTYGSMTRALTDDEVRTLGGATSWHLTPADPMGTTVRRTSGTGGHRLVVRNRFSFDPKHEVPDSRFDNINRDHDRSFAIRFPMLAGVEMEYRWGGRLCLSPNNVGAFGEVAPGLFSACCQNGLGAAKGTMHGMAAAELAAGEQTELVEYLLTEAAPKRVPGGPFAKIGANAVLKWKEFQARREF